MSATVVPDATLVVDTPRRGADAAQLAADPSIAETLRGVLAALLASLSPAAIPRDAT